MFEDITFKGTYEISTIKECASSYYFIIASEPIKTVTGTYVESVDSDLVYTDESMAGIPAKTNYNVYKAVKFVRQSSSNTTINGTDY
jgi:hypothetical protein